MADAPRANRVYLRICDLRRGEEDRVPELSLEAPADEQRLLSLLAASNGERVA